MLVRFIMKKTFIFFIFLYGNLYLLNSVAGTCQPLLWPVTAWKTKQLGQIPAIELSELKKQARKGINQKPHAIIQLNSAGKTSSNDLNLRESRQALREAELAASMALLYQINHDSTYIEGAKSILLKWANVNEPTGNPIDETRLQGLIWAYDLIACDLTAPQKEAILTWFKKLRAKKQAWQFGRITGNNNHRIHHLKILMLLDKVLQKKIAWQTDLVDAERYSFINLNPTTGISVDYKNRSSLYYHNYTLQPWLEINLIAKQRFKPVDKAFEFLINEIKTDNIHHEFTHSKAKIDSMRAKGGFAYAKKDSTFDITRAAPTIISYYTGNCHALTPDLINIINAAKPSPWLAFIKVRRSLWNNC